VDICFFVLLALPHSIVLHCSWSKQKQNSFIEMIASISARAVLLYLPASIFIGERRRKM
jgi:hypothetical protein